MKYILILLSSLFISQNIGQITIRGVKNTEIIETNTDKEDLGVVKNVKFTKTIEEKEKQDFIKKNSIKNGSTRLVGEAVEINIIEPEELVGNEKKQIIVDLDKAKEAADSVNLLRNPELALEKNKVQEIETSQEINLPENETIVEQMKQDISISENASQSNSKKTEEIVAEREILANKKTSNKSENKIEIDKETQQQLLEFKEQTKDLKNLEAEEVNFKDNEFETEELEYEDEKTTTVSESGIVFGSKNEKEKTTEKDSNIKSETTKGNLNDLSNIDEPKSIKSSSTLENTETAEEKTSTANPKRGSWSIGLRAGIPAIIGDIDSRLGYGFSLNVQKALGHVFALRFEALALETKGLNNEPNNNIYQNYKTRFTDYTLQGVITLNNMNFYKKEPKVLFNIAVGAGLATRYTWTDAVNENGMIYNYDNISGESPRDVVKAINSLRDNNYETSIPKDADKMSINNTNILPTIMLGFGVDFKLSEKFDLNIATRASYHFDDYLDGYKNGNNIDVMTFTSVGLTYKFGSKNKSLTWTNPVYSKVEEINELKKKVDEGDLLKDEDKDGIADIFDQDLNTPPKVAVDSRGVASDMDKDGVADFEDAEPFTPLGAQVDSRGVAIDTDNDGIADILDQENNTLAGSQVDSRGKTIIPARNASNDLAAMRSSSDFDLIFFDENSATIKKEFYSDLYKITRYIQGNPTAKIEIIGHTDILAGEDYNLNLSERRANAVYSMLIEMFKIPSRNLSTRFEGEKNPIIEGLPERKDRKFEAAYYINRRVEFKIVE